MVRLANFIKIRKLKSFAFQEFQLSLSSFAIIPTVLRFYAYGITSSLIQISSVCAAISASLP